MMTKSSVFDIPEPLRVRPQRDGFVFLVDLLAFRGTRCHKWTNSVHDDDAFKNGLVHQYEENARKHAEALFQLTRDTKYDEEFVKFAFKENNDSTEVLRVTPEGEFIWHPDADKLLAEGDFSQSPALPHILRALRKQHARKPLTDEAKEVIDAARAAMDDSVEAYDSAGSIKISSHLAASLSLCLDEYDRAIEAAHGIKGDV